MYRVVAGTVSLHPYKQHNKDNKRGGVAKLGERERCAFFWPAIHVLLLVEDFRSLEKVRGQLNRPLHLINFGKPR